LRVLFAPDRNDELGFDWFWNEKSFKVFWVLAFLITSLLTEDPM
jgi:hypothetical protein